VSYLLNDATGRIAAVLIAIAIAIAIATVAKALASVLRTWIEQAFRTRRLARSLEDTKPHQRPEIIKACGQLEERSAGGSDTVKTGSAFPAGGYRRPAALISHDKRGSDRHED
jgi:hypothetical protein